MSTTDKPEVKVEPPHKAAETSDKSVQQQAATTAADALRLDANLTGKTTDTAATTTAKAADSAAVVTDTAAKPVDTTVRGFNPTSADLVGASVNALTKAQGTEQVLAVLQGKSASERQAILEGYKQVNTTDLLSDLGRKGISGTDYTRVVTAIRKPDGVTDTAGSLERNLASIQASPGTADQTQAERQMRDNISTLSTKELQDLDRTLKASHNGQGLKELLLDNQTITAGTRKALELQLYGQSPAPSERTLQGSDYRSGHPEVALALAENALANKDLSQFQEAMRNAPEAARQSFAQGKDGKTGEQRLAEVFKDAELSRATDFMYRGGVKLESLVTANDKQFLFWRMQGGIDVALSNARVEDVDSYRRGQTLANQSTDKSNLTPEQKRDLDFYGSLNARLKQAFSEPGQLIAQEDLLLNQGSFISQYAGGKSPNERFAAIERMSESERVRLNQSPEMRAQLERAITQLAPGEEANRAKQLLERKLSAPSEAEAQKVGRTVTETLQDNPPPPYHHADVLNSLARMSGDEAKRYREDAQFRRETDAKLKEYLGERALPGLGAPPNWTDPQLRLAERMTSALAKGEDPTGDPTSRVVLQALRATEGQNNSIGGLNIISRHPEEARGIHQAIEKILKDDPALAARIKANPNSPEAHNFSFALRVESGAAKPPLQDYELGPMLGRFYRDGHLNVADRARFAQTPEDKYRAVVETSSPQERQMLLQKDAQGPASELQYAVFGRLSAEHKAVLTNGLQSGALDAADKARLAVLDNNLSTANLGTILKDQDISQVKADYARKYGRDMDADALERAPIASRLAVQELLSSSRTTSGDQFIARQPALDARPGSTFFNSDGDVANLEASRNNIAQMLTQASAEQRQVNDADYKRRIGAMDQAITQYDKDQNRTREALDQAIQTTIQAAVFASAVLSDGLTLPIALSVAGATFHAALSNDTDPWSRTKTLAKGFVDSAVMAIPGSQLGAMMRISESAAQVTATRLAGSTLLREGAQTEVQASLQGLASNAIKSGNTKIGQEEFTRVAGTLAKPGATPEEVSRLAATLQTEYQAAVNKGAADYFTTAVQLREAAKIGGLSSSLAGTVNGAIDYDPRQSVAANLTRIGASASLGAIEGAGMTVAFGYGITAIRGVLRRGADGNLTVRSEGSDTKQLEIVSTGPDGREIVKTVPKDVDTPILPTDVLRVKAANDNGLTPTPTPAEALLPPLQLVVGVDPRNVPRAANENHPRADNDNLPYIQEPMVVNGNQPITAAGRDESGNRPRLSLVNNDRPLSDSRPTDLDRPATTDRTSARPTTAKPGDKAPLSEEALTRALGANASNIKALEADPKFKAHIEWLKAHSGETDPKAYSDMILLAKRVESTGTPSLLVPLERLQDAPPATLRFIRDRMVEAGNGFKRPVDEQQGKQYEYAASRYLMERFSGKNSEPISIPDVTDGRTHASLNANMRDWVYIPSAQGSPMDHAKVDGMFINVKDGRFIPVDIKMNQKAVDKKENADNLLNLTFDEGNTSRPLNATNGFFVRDPSDDMVVRRFAEILDPTRSAGLSTNVSVFNGAVTYPELKDRTNREMAQTLRTFMDQMGKVDNKFMTDWAARVQRSETYYRRHENPNARAEGVPEPSQNLDLAATPQQQADAAATNKLFIRLQFLDDKLKLSDREQLGQLQRDLTGKGVQASDSELLSIYHSSKDIKDPIQRAQARQAAAETFATLRLQNPDISLKEMNTLTQYRNEFQEPVTLAHMRETEKVLEVYKQLGQTPPSRMDAYIGVLDNQTERHAVMALTQPIRANIDSWLSTQSASGQATMAPILDRFFTPGARISSEDANRVQFALTRYFEQKAGVSKDVAATRTAIVMQVFNRAMRP
jgi:hypothetical protein